jgi:hypothetical protein
MKRCTKCRVNKPLTDFHSKRDTKDGLRSYCRECTKNSAAQRYKKHSIKIKSKNAQWYKNNAEYAKKHQALYRKNNLSKVRTKNAQWHFKSKYGITLENRNAMLVAQNGMCAVCKDNITNCPCVDHCHTTKDVRGLLCHTCNTTIGMAKDSPAILRNAANYIEMHKHPTIDSFDI